MQGLKNASDICVNLQANGHLIRKTGIKESKCNLQSFTQSRICWSCMSQTCTMRPVTGPPNLTTWNNGYRLHHREFRPSDSGQTDLRAGCKWSPLLRRWVCGCTGAGERTSCSPIGSARNRGNCMCGKKIQSDGQRDGGSEWYCGINAGLILAITTASVLTRLNVFSGDRWGRGLRWTEWDKGDTQTMSGNTE